MQFSNLFHLTSGESYASAGGIDKRLHFSNPSIRSNNVVKGSIHFQKQWEDHNNNWDTRENITLELQVQDPHSKQWSVLQTKILEKGKDLSGTFEDVVLKFNDIEYVHKVTEHKLNSYKDPTYSIVDGVHWIKNELKLRPLDLTKVGDSKDLKLKDVEFTLYRYTGDEFDETKTHLYKKVDLKSNEFGKLVVSNDKNVEIPESVQTPVGNYLLRETKPLQGYKNMEDIAFTVGNDMSIIGIDNNIVNKLKPFELQVSKLDERNSPLNGAEFQLKSIDGTSYESSSDGDYQGHMFIFKNLTPGHYELFETKIPDGYIGLNESIKIEIQTSGKVIIDGVEKTDSGVLQDGNFIYLDVINTPKGILPETGGIGTNLFIVGGLTLILISIIVFTRTRRVHEHSIKSQGIIKITLILTAFMLLIPNVIIAKSDFYTIMIHNRLQENTADMYSNSGIEYKEKDTYRVNGKRYKVYDGEYLLSEFSDKYSIEDIQQIVMNTQLKNLHQHESIMPYLLGTSLSQNVGGQDGIAVFKQPKANASKALLFVQDKQPDESHEFSSMLLVLPITDPNNSNKELEVVHLYPKLNSPITEIPPPIIDELPATGISNSMNTIYGAVLSGLGLMIFVLKSIKEKGEIK